MREMAEKAPKKKAAAKPAKKAGPGAKELILDAVTASKEKKGMSYVAMKKHLAAKGYDVEHKTVLVKRAIKSLVDSGALVQLRGSGASGSFKAKPAEKPKKAAKKAVAAPAPKAKKAVTPKKAARKPAAAKKARAAKASPKKTVKKAPAAKKVPAKKVPKSPKKATKKAASPKKAVTPKKPAKKAAKPKAKKPAAKKPAKK
uniref:H15 domain-containing protein n=1 Tax=Scophthalmus maximus TaxID=52904 RepID=A0A8D3CZ73_SCOMX